MSFFDNKHLFELMLNPSAISGVPYGTAQAEVLNAEGLLKAKQVICSWPGYAVTPLIDFPGLARATGIANIHYKDEAQRFGLKSFKPLGGAYAVARLLMRTIATDTRKQEISIHDLLDGKYKEICAGITVTAATDGNHGRSVAWGARMFGCRCIIFINEAVSEQREHAIADLGAVVRRNPGSYDDAVRTARETAIHEGWHVVPDTSDGCIIEAPRNVTQGYALMAAESIEQLPYNTPPTHIFLQAGVGGMAAATCAQFWQHFGVDRPKTILVEPDGSACWFESLKRKEPVVIKGSLDSLMGGLACGEVSRLAWIILKPGANAAMKISDEAAADAMRLLAAAECGDAPLVAGESGVAGLAGFLAIAGDRAARGKVGLDSSSRVVLFGTEGATDPQAYAEIVGRKPEAIAV
ncbi:MAG: diaminopropionate ammonia-lyase [Gammaproteobacteria bacterium]|nr:diaminopropionate ammonia-lyase [Gammaproteobacteria bacterium]